MDIKEVTNQRAENKHKYVAMVDEAARDGLEIARTLQGAGYDLNAVTPDADNWKYGSFF